jgi:fibronectin-binding autotransporter adhesin
MRSGTRCTSRISSSIAIQVQPNPRRGLLALALLAIGLLCASARAQTDTWTGGGADANWQTALNWSGGAPTAGETLDFTGSTQTTNNNNYTANTVFGEIEFDSSASSFTLTGNAVNMPSTGGSIVDNSANAQTIDTPIVLAGGANGVSVTNVSGSLSLGDANQTGTMLTFGSALYSSTDSTLNVNNNFTVTSQALPVSPATTTYGSLAPTLLVQTNDSGTNTNTINIASGATFNTIDTTSVTSGTSPGINSAVVVIGAPQNVSTSSPNHSTNTSLTVSGAGTWNVTDAGDNFLVGVSGDNNSDSTTQSTLNMSGLANFVLNDSSASVGFGDLDIGYGTRSNASALYLANTTNNITVGRVIVGDSNQTPGAVSVSGVQENGNNDIFLNLGNGTNVFNLTGFEVGVIKETGTVQFQSSTGSITIEGPGGAGTAATELVVGDYGGGGNNFPNSSTMSLAGHTANINTTTLDIGGEQSGNLYGNNNNGAGISNSGSESITGAMTFDTGTINTTNLYIDGIAANGDGNDGILIMGGSLVMGGNSPNTSATGVLNVGSSTTPGTFYLGNAATSNVTTSYAIFTINGGTANIFGNIVDNSTDSTPLHHTSELNLASGTLNMEGNSIGSSTSPIYLVTLPAGGNTATLENLGGTGIYSTYSTAPVYNSTYSTPPTTPGVAGSVNGGLLMNFGGKLILAGTNTYTGGTTISAGILSVSGSITDTVGTVNVNSGGTLSTPNGTTTGSIAGPVSVNSGGALAMGDISTLNFSGGLTIHSGSSVSMNLGSGFTSDLLNITAGGLTIGDASSTNPTLNINGSPSAGSYDLMNYVGGLTENEPFSVNGPAGFNYTLNYGSTTPGEILLNVTVASNVLTWTGSYDGTSWDVNAAHTNWSNGVAVGYSNSKAVLFSDSAPAGDTTINLAANGITPSSITVNTSSNSYTLESTGGFGISGSGSLIKEGATTFTVLNNNSFTGGTTISGGAVQVGNGTGSTGSLGSGTITDDAALAYDLTGTNTVSNTITGTGTLTQMAGTLILTAGNSYLTTTINGGATLQIDNGTSNTGTVGTDQITDNGTLAIDRADSAGYTLANAITGSGGVTAMAANILQLTGNNSYTGALVINSGSTVEATDSQTVGSTGGTAGAAGNVVTVNSGGTFDMGAAPAGSLNFGTRLFQISGTGVGGAGAIENSASTQQVNAMEYMSLTGNATINAVGGFGLGQSGSGDYLALNGNTLTKIGSGEFDVLGTAHVEGPGTIIDSAGTFGLQIGATDDANVTIQYLDGTDANYYGTSGAGLLSTVIIGNGQTGQSAGVTLGDNNTTLQTSTLAGPVELEDNLTINGGGNTSIQIRMTGNITSTDNGDNGTPYTLTVGDEGLYLSGNDTYDGETTINNGVTLQLGSSTAFPLLASGYGRPLVVYGTFDLNGNNATVGSLNNSSGIIGNSSTTANSTLIYAGNSTSANPDTFSGTLQDVIGSGTQTLALSVTSGYLILNGSSNYSGGTTVSSGATLDLVSSSALPSNNPNVTNNGSLMIDSGINAGTISGSGTTTVSVNNNLNVVSLTQSSLVNNGTVTIAGSSGGGSVGSVTGTGNLILGDGSNTITLALTGNKLVSSQTSLTINPAAALDLGNNAFVISDGGSPASTEAVIQQFVENGQGGLTAIAGGGTIISSYAALNGLDVAYADASDTNMAGSKLATNNPGDIVIEPALAGDTDLNGLVNIHDLTNLLSNFNSPGFWDQGNFNGHANVDISDLSALLSNFNTSTTLTYAELNGIENLVGQFGFEAIANSNGQGFALVAVPEPASVSLIAMGAVGLLSRRRKH